MGTCAIFADDNIRLLEQGLELLRSLSDDAYVRSSHPEYTSGVGGHLRHCLDHYTNFLDGVAVGKVDYDARQRDARIESDRFYASSIMERIITGLRALRESDATNFVTIKMDGGDDSDTDNWWSPSSAQRELQFLLSHTVHHYALVSLILRAQGISLAPGFGVAPSTIRYQQNMESVAGVR
ncbi:MAG TPA: hypothetical protein VIH35_00800 [Kiritimatiellia bacterium]|jgi:uncharacterized damage-inducible protein DinB